MTVFISGQRWISLAEPELGLGIVSDIEHRRVNIEFPLAECSRLYSIDTTPLIRSRFSIGDNIILANGTLTPVTAVDDVQGVLHYTYSGGLKVSETDLDCDQGKVSPLDRLQAGQVGSFKWFDLYRVFLEATTEHQGKQSYGFVGPKINIIPHQYDVAQQILKMPVPRALLADEVGLGKTIEAGLVIHQLMMSGRAQRILICVPASLVNQWLVEMKRKFNLDCTLIDDEYCAQQDGDNPFNQVQVALCNFDWLTHSKYLEQAQQTQWDMLVIDESHRLQWQSKAYQSALALSHVSVGVLLLTATPEQLGVESHFARLHLLDPLRFSDLDQFLQEEQQYGLVSEIVDSIELDGLAASLDQIAKLDDDKLLVFAQDSIENQLDESMFVDWMADRYGTGRMVYRNTRRTIAGFPERHSQFYHLKDQSNLEWLLEWLGQQGEQKVLLICQSAEDAQNISLQINAQTSIQSGAFHENYSLIERDQIAAKFVEEDGLQVLICSEIGGEGRNFQHAQHLVLFDLPNHPDLVDQRIGRLDRIGQGSDIYIHVPVQSKSAQARLAALYHHGFDMFKQPNPAASPIYEAYGIEIDEMLETGEQAESVILQCQQASMQLLTEIEQGRDRLLEKHSYSEERVSSLLTAIDDADKQEDDLRVKLLNIFDNAHIDTEQASAQNIIVSPQENCPFSFMNDLKEDRATITFSREQASLREDLEFISWDHPWVKGIIDDLEASGNAFTACTLFKDENFRNGQVLVEAHYQVKAEGPGRLQLNRYLAPQTRHYTISDELKNLTRSIDLAEMREKSEYLAKDMAKELINMKWSEIVKAISLSEMLAEHTTGESIKASVASMLESTKHELARYKSLEIEPGSYQQEVDTLTQNAKESAAYLQAAKPKLMGLCIWVNFLQ
jgi:ATP-dependent helicase HepA